MTAWTAFGAASAQTARAGPNDWCPPPSRLAVVFADDFSQGMAAWRVEAQDPRSRVQPLRVDGRWVLDVQAPAGLTLWLPREWQGDYAIRFTATPLPAPAEAGALAGRISDLNMFWNASEADDSPPQVRDGAFTSYDTLRAWYVGFGANGNTTTRLRRYDGSGQRELLDGYADGAEASAADRQGAMTTATRLQAGQPVKVQIVARTPTGDDPVHTRWWADGRQLFALSMPLHPPLPLRGHFALRTTASRFQFADFQVLTCQPVHPGR